MVIFSISCWGRSPRAFRSGEPKYARLQDIDCSFCFKAPNPNKRVGVECLPGAVDRHAQALVQRSDMGFEDLNPSKHLARMDIILPQLKNH